MARSSFDFNLGASNARAARRRDEESPMRMLVVGDFGGTAPRDDYAKRKPMKVDIDNFDQVMRRIGPRVRTAAGDELTLGELDDFHPDSLYRTVPVFERLRDLRDRLQSTSTFAAASEQFRAHVGAAPAGGADRATQNAATRERDDETLSRLLGGAGAAAPAPSARGGIDDFIRGIVAEHIQPDAPAHQAQYVAAADAAIGAHMQAVLHDDAFQSLEALWRGVYWLVSNLELGDTLQLSILDASKADLLADVCGPESDLSRAATYKTLVDAAEVAGAQPWSLVVGAYEFGAGGEDIALLATLGALASQAGAAFIGQASAELAGADSFASPDASAWRDTDDARFDAWHALRHSAMASHIALAAPRMLLRLPYGKNTERVSAFDFAELSVERPHERYLWGSGAFACALLIGRAFTERGWEMEPGDALDVDDLPAHAFDEDGEKHMQACAETYLSERAGQALIERGLIPLLSYANRNAIRVMRFQSIAEPAQALVGPWAVS